MERIGRTMLCLLAAIGCSITALADETKVVICHRAGPNPHIVAVSAAALPAHVAHGDYLAQLVADPGNSALGDGIHFARITDALAAARAGRIARGELRDAACRITIIVAPGLFQGSFDASAPPSLEQFPLYVDVPQITLRGGLRMRVDADGRATGESEDEGSVTTLAPDRPLRDGPPAEGMIVAVGHPDGSRADGTVVEGFAFRSGHLLVDGFTGGAGIFALRITDLVVRGNRFEPTLTAGLTSVATSARVERNYAYRLGANCAICLSGPGNYEVLDNRLLEGGLGGIYLTAIGDVAFSLGAHAVAGAEPYVAVTPPAVTAIVENNEIRDHVSQPIGFGVRVIAFGSVPLAIPQSTRVTLRDNDIVHNTFGLIVDAGFPVGGSQVGADVDVALESNAFSATCQNDLLVAFTRHRAALGIALNPFAHNATYRLGLGGDLDWSQAWYSDPPGFGNTLVVDGIPVAPGSRVAYDPARPCSP
jgi:hypothetical protein